MDSTMVFLGSVPHSLPTRTSKYLTWLSCVLVGGAAGSNHLWNQKPDKKLIERLLSSLLLGRCGRLFGFVLVLFILAGVFEQAQSLLLPFQGHPCGLQGLTPVTYWSRGIAAW